MCKPSAGVMPVADRMIAVRPAIDLERPEHPPVAAARLGTDHEAAGEALAGTQPLRPRSGGTTCTTRRRRPAAARHLRLVPMGRCAKISRAARPPAPWCATSACGRSSTRSRSRRRRRVVHRLAPDRCLPVRVAREFAIIDARQETPIDTSSPVAVVRPLWQASTRERSRRGDSPAALAGPSSDPPAALPPPAMDDEGGRERAPATAMAETERCERARHPHQPSLSPPSNQSHRK
jgi:hypothetical protein